MRGEILARLDAFEGRLERLENRTDDATPLAVREEQRRRRDPDTTAPQDGEVSERIERMLQDHQDQAVERRIEIREQEVDSVIDRYVADADLSSEQVTVLRGTLRDSVERLTSLTEEGKNAIRPWSEIRPEINRVHEDIVEDLRSVFSEREIEALAEAGLIVHQQDESARPATTPISPAE